MLRVALTGGIGTGKSAVLGVLADLGVPVLDADPLAHAVMRAGTTGAMAVRMRFGEGVMLPDGHVDRRKLGQVVFSDDQARRDLEAIIHPEVYRTIDGWMRSQAESGSTMAVAEIQLLFETDHAGDFDRTMVAACEAETQVRRAMRRTGLSEADVRARIAAQMPVAEKVRIANYVVWTDGTMADTRARTEAVWRELLRDASAS